MLTRKTIPGLFVTGIAVAALLAACAPAAPPAPTPAPPAPAPAPAQPEKPTAAPAAPAPKPPEAPAKAEPTPAPKPEAKPAGRTFNEQAVADFYRGKTVRIILGLPPGSGADLTARLVGRHISKYIPGNPTVIVENRPGAGGLLAANTVYAAEPRDGTVIGAVLEGMVLQQALDAPGIEFDVTQYQWIGSLVQTQGACLARIDTGIDTVRDLMNGQELIVATSGPGSTPHDIPAVLSATLDANFRLVPGYPGGAPSLQAVERQEVDGYCVSLSAMLTTARALLDGENPTAKIIVVLGSTVPDDPLLEGVPAAEPLATTEEARQLLRAVAAPGFMTRPFTFPPEVPQDRVQAMREAFDRTMADPEFIEEATRAQVDLDPNTGEEVTRIVQEMLGLPPEVLTQLQEILK